MRVAHRPRLAEKKDLVVAHTEDLARHVARLVGTQADHQRRHALGHQLLQAVDTLFLLGRFGRDALDHARPGKGSDGVGAHAEFLHVERDRFRQRRDAELGRAVVGLAEIADEPGGAGHYYK